MRIGVGVGAPDHQKLIIDLEMGWDISAAASSDALEDTLSAAAAKRVNAFVVETQANLVETLVEGIAGLLQEEFGVPLPGPNQ